MSLREEVAQWTAQARQTLEEAQKISTLAHASLNYTADLLTTQLPAQITAAEENYETVLKQRVSLLLLAKNLQKSVASTINGHEKKVATILHPVLRDLEAVLAILNTVKVPLFLLKSIGDGLKTGYCLADFVASEEIAVLRGNVQIYLGNCEKTSLLLQKRLDETLAGISGLQARFSKLSALYETQILPLKPILKYVSVDVRLNKAPLDLVGTVLKENNALGLELTSLLHMLTKHYDQCMLACNWTQEFEMDHDVLRADTLELPAVLKEVHAIHDIIMHNGKRASAFAALKAKAIDLVSRLCDVFLCECSDYELRDITLFLLLLVHGQTVYITEPKTTSETPESAGKNGITPVENYATTLAGLADHYRQFCAVYQAQYLSELHYEKFVYPRKFLKVLDECLNGKLLAFEDAEQERRREWLYKYGDFIPNDFYLPGESEQPRVVQVISEGLDHLEAVSSRDDEDRLVQLLKDTRLLQGK